MNNDGCLGCLPLIIILAVLGVIGFFINIGVGIILSIIFIIVGVLRYLLKILRL